MAKTWWTYDTKPAHREAVIAFLLERDGPRCGLCGDLLEERGHGADALTVDHVLPVSYGGKHRLENFRLLHRRCNSSDFQRNYKRPLTEEGRRNVSEATRRSWQQIPYQKRMARRRGMTGLNHSSEAIAKMRVAHANQLRNRGRDRLGRLLPSQP